MKLKDIQAIVDRARKAQHCYISMGIDIDPSDFGDNGGIVFHVYHSDDGKHKYFRDLASAITELRVLAGDKVENTEEIE